jgi:phage terminase small subunit
MLTPKQQRFVAEYLVDLNATQAAVRAGYSPRTARSIASENLSKPDIAAAIATAKAQVSRRTEVTIEAVVAELAKLGFADAGRPTPAVKHDALVSLGKHLGMFADRHILEGSLEHRIMGMTRDERLAKAREIIMLGQAYLPLLARQRAEQEMRAIEHEQARVAGEASEADAASAELDEKYE